MTRHELRESIFLLLFRIEFHEVDQLPEQLQIFMDSISHEREKDTHYIEEKYDLVMSHLTEIDEKINAIIHAANEKIQEHNDFIKNLTKEKKNLEIC